MYWKACRYLAQLTRAKALWIQIFRRNVTDLHFPSPTQYCKPLHDLTAAACESIAARSLRLQKCLSSPQQNQPAIVPLNLARSVTWVRIIEAQWPLVASSDNRHSVLSLWALGTASHSGASPVTEAFLHGPVKTGQCDVRNGVVTVALELCMET